MNLLLKTYVSKISITVPHVIIGVIKWTGMWWVGHVARMGETGGAYRVLVGTPEWKGPFGRPGRRWENNNKTHLQLAGWGDVDWIDLAWGRDWWRALVSAAMNLRVPYSAANCLTRWEYISFSRKTVLHEVSLAVPNTRHLHSSNLQWLGYFPGLKTI